MSILEQFNDLYYTGEQPTASNIQIFLNLRDNESFDFSGIDEYNLLYRIEELFLDYIYRKTEDMPEYNIWDLLDDNDVTDSLAIYMYIDDSEDLTQLAFITSHEQLVNASRMFALQDMLRDSIGIWKLDFEEELSIRFNKFITLWKNRRDKNRKEVLDSLKIHSVQDVVIGYL